MGILDILMVSSGILKDSWRLLRIFWDFLGFFEIWMDSLGILWGFLEIYEISLGYCWILMGFFRDFWDIWDILLCEGSFCWMFGICVGIAR